MKLLKNHTSQLDLEIDIEVLDKQLTRDEFIEMSEEVDISEEDVQEK